MSFGLIPLFSIPVIAAGMDSSGILVYRFLFGGLVLLAVLLYRREDLRLNMGDAMRVGLISLFYIGTSLATLECYKYLSSRIATSLFYTDPIWCALIGMLFLHERFSLRLTTSILLATIGVMMMTGVFSEEIRFSWIGLAWGLASGLFYAFYLLAVPRMRIRSMPSLKLTFYVFFLAMLMLCVYEVITKGAIPLPHGTMCWFNLFLLGLIPTAISYICVTMSLKQIDSTLVALLGALEPVTAMVVGIMVLGDPFSLLSILGTVLILIAVFAAPRVSGS